jgi:hypothetical protein
MKQVRNRVIAGCLSSGLALASISFSALAADNPDRLLWGDTHVHTSYSFDAFLNQNHSADPDTAYRWAKGQPVIHPYNRARVQLSDPLDFLVVSDHAELMGVIRAIDNGTAELEDDSFWAGIERRVKTFFLQDAIEKEAGRSFFSKLLPVAGQNPGEDPVQDTNNDISNRTFGDSTVTETKAWHEIVDAAERHNDPGKFTSIMGWEWSSIPTGANLHRVVITPDDGIKAKQFLPYGSDQSQYPEDLWNWLEETTEKTGARFISIPHNSNISKGYMFAETNLRGEAITADYAKRRMDYEPIVEMTQIKGDSETHPSLSPNDEFADFETYKFYIQQEWSEYKPTEADYVRSALKTGLNLQNKIGVNPYKFGFIGSTDAHTGLSTAEEENFWGKMAKDSTPETKRTTAELDSQQPSGWNMAAQGLAAVWANDNNREESNSAFKRKETYATTGPRISLRMFASWGFDAADAQAKDFADIGYAKGVPMGGDLIATSDEAASAPMLLLRAVKDPKGANLDRIQVVKGWVDSSGVSQEKVFNVAWSGERNIDAQGQISPLENTVDVKSATYDRNQGSAELAVVWQDPEFDLSQRSFYYTRVLQVPTPRHSLYDAVALDEDAPEEAPASIQERAYSSPIWYNPS